MSERKADLESQSNAPKDVVDLISQGDATVLASSELLGGTDRNMLIQLRALIDQKLAAQTSHPMDLPNGGNNESNITPQPSPPQAEKQNEEDTEMLL
jgi:hypothetical protein